MMRYGVPATPTGGAGTVTTGGTAQAIAAARTNRVQFMFANLSASPMMVSCIGTASATAGFPVAPGAVLVINAPAPNTAISLYCAATGAAFYVEDY